MDIGLAPILIKRDTCAGCTLAFKRVVKTCFQSQSVGERHGGPEFEAAATFGSLCLNRDIHSICLANQLCNQYGPTDQKLGELGTGNCKG